MCCPYRRSGGLRPRCIAVLRCGNNRQVVAMNVVCMVLSVLISTKCIAQQFAASFHECLFVVKPCVRYGCGVRCCRKSPQLRLFEEKKNDCAWIRCMLAILYAV